MKPLSHAQKGKNRRDDRNLRLMGISRVPFWRLLSGDGCALPLPLVGFLVALCCFRGKCVLANLLFRLQHRQKGLLGDLDITHGLHPFFARLLLFQQLPFS